MELRDGGRSAVQLCSKSLELVSRTFGGSENKEKQNEGMSLMTVEVTKALAIKKKEKILLKLKKGGEQSGRWFVTDDGGECLRSAKFTLQRRPMRRVQQQQQVTRSAERLPGGLHVRVPVVGQSQRF